MVGTLTPIERTEVVERINDVKTDLSRDIEAVHEEVKGLRADLNGRLRALERWKAYSEGMKAAFHWVPTLVAGLLSAGATAAVTLLLVH